MDIFTCMNRIRNGEDGGVVDSQNQSPPWEYLHLQNIFFLHGQEYYRRLTSFFQYEPFPS
jgi:hypothetical protein